MNPILNCYKNVIDNSVKFSSDHVTAVSIDLSQLCAQYWSEEIEDFERQYGEVSVRTSHRQQMSGYAIHRMAVTNRRVRTLSLERHSRESIYLSLLSSWRLVHNVRLFSSSWPCGRRRTCGRHRQLWWKQFTTSRVHRGRPPINQSWCMAGIYNNNTVEGRGLTRMESIHLREVD